MRKFLHSVLLAAFLSLTLSGAAYSDIAGIYAHDSDGAMYDPRMGMPVQLKETISGFQLPVVSMLPEAIPAPDASPMIAIVIDDMGIDLKRSERAVRNLKSPVTMSYLAYAHHIGDQVAAAREKGHEIVLHLPWEADSPKANPGPNHLSVNMTSEQIQKNLQANLEKFQGYVGVNNHMGSRFSRYRAGLEIVMAELKKRGLFYMDSKTTPDSIAEKVAMQFDVPAAHRDVFLDHDESSRRVRVSLQEVESIARRKGSVIAIGHPKDVTLSALEAWLPAVEARGFRLVTLSEVIKHRQMKREAHVAHLESAQ